MSSIGTGYDFSATTFSPDGRIFQVEYAEKAVENSGTAIAIKCTDGVVFGCERIIISKLHEPYLNQRHYSVSSNVGITFSGLSADAKHIVNRARFEAKDYLSSFKCAIPCKVLAQRISQYMQNYTLYSFVRPFGCSIIIGNYEENESPQLFMIEPSGRSFGYNACAIGKGKQQALTHLEKLSLGTMTMNEAVLTIAKTIYCDHDSTKDKEFILEMSWVGKRTSYQHEFVPQHLITEAVNFATHRED